MKPTIKGKTDSQLEESHTIAMPKKDKIWLILFVISALIVTGNIVYWKQPAENQKAELQQIALYTKEVTNMPLSNARNEYLVFTKNKLLEGGKLNKWDVKNTEAMYERALESASSNREIKNEIIGQIDATADLPEK